MKLYVPLLFVIAFALFPPGVIADGITKEIIRSQNKDRVYYLYVPDKLSQTKPVPLIVLLHGSGRTGNSLVEKWKDLAKKEQFIIVGPDALNTQGWTIPGDGPDFIYEVVEALKAKYPINARRVYLFGHSAGAGQSLLLSLLESEYFAATAIHAGALHSDDGPFIEHATRKIPIAIWVGTNDEYFPLPVVRATRDMLVSAGFQCELTEIKNHTHWYYDTAAETNAAAWNFLKVFSLKDDPKYENHNFR